MQPNPQHLAEALDNAGGLSIARVGYLSGRQIVMTVNWQGEPLTFQATITDVLSGHLPSHPRHRNETAHIGQKNLYEQHYSEAEVRHLGCPLYLAEEWLRREKDRLGTFAAISREYGYPEATLQGASRLHGWTPEKPPRPTERDQVRAAWQAGQRNKKALASRYGVSIGSVFTWVRDLP